MGDPVTRRGSVRPAVAAFALAIFATLLLRTIVVGVGADEFSLLVMAGAIADGAFPYAEYWDVRPPLAYLLGLPAALVENTGRAIATLRLSAWLAHAMAAYVFFCLFQRALGAWPTAVGVVALLATANATELHAAVLPNHFVMCGAVFAFAGLVAALRAGWLALIGAAVLAGALPWFMVHAALVSGSLTILALVGLATARRRLAWLLAAFAPTVVVIGAYWFWGPFDALARTVFLAPLDVLAMRGGGYHFFSADVVWRTLARAPWAVVFVLAMAVGAACWLGAWRSAPGGGALRCSPFLLAPLAAGFLAMAYAKPPAPPEYWVEAAPVIGLWASAAANRLADWPGWRRMRNGAALAGVALAMFGAVLALPVNPWREPVRPPLPRAYCKEAAGRWLARLRAGDTVVDFTGLCGYQILDADVAVQPPFAFAPMWLRQLDQPWVGAAADGNREPGAAAERLRRVLGLAIEGAPRGSSRVALILADNRLLNQVRQRGWGPEFHAEWRFVWFRRLAAASGATDTDEAFASLAVLVRRRWETPPPRT